MIESGTPAHQHYTTIQYVARGVLTGIGVWLAYGILESAITTLVPWLWPSHQAADRQNPLFLLILIVLYGAAGAVMGGLWGWICSVFERHSSAPTGLTPNRLLEAGALISVLAVFSVRIALRHGLERAPLIVLTLSFALAIAALLRARPDGWSRWVEATANPWAALAIVVSTAWFLLEVLRRHDSQLLKGTVVVACVLTVSGAALSVRTLMARRSRPARAPACCRLRWVLPAALVSLLLTFWTYGPRSPLDLGIESTSAAKTFPNIILIILDTVRADHMSIYGYGTPTTPNLEKLAREATLYSRAIATSDMTLASHASILTGLYARSHGARYYPPTSPYGAPLSDDFDTLAEILRRSGYATAGVVANDAYLGRGMNLQQGFQFWDDRRGVPLLTPSHGIFLRDQVYQSLRRLLPQVASDKEFRNAEEINEDVVDLIDRELATESPFFLLVNYMDAHWPYLPPSPFDTLVPGKNPRLRTDEYYALDRSVHTEGTSVPATWQRHLTSQYDGAIAYLDDQVSRLIDKLRALDLYENSLVIITSDHGEAFGRRHLIGHAVSVYQDQVHVPLLVKWPNAEGGHTEDALVSHVDLLPTVLDLLRRDVPPAAGVSLLDRSRSNAPARHIVSESYPNGVRAQWDVRYDRVERALFFDDLKLITSSRGKQELFALTPDPNEYDNLMEEDPERSILLRGLLDDWLATNSEFLLDEDSTRESVEMDEETRDRLRSLGYIQ